MFDESWMEYFKNESPFAYHCVLFISFLWDLVCYIFYLIPLVVIVLCIVMMVSGIKGIKVKFIQHKKPGIQNFLKSKLTDKEQKYLKQMKHDSHQWFEMQPNYP